MRLVSILILAVLSPLLSLGCNDLTSRPMNNPHTEKRDSNKNTEEVVLTDEFFYMLPSFSGRVVKCENKGYPDRDLYRNYGPLLRITVAANDGRLFVIENFRSGLHAAAEVSDLTEKPQLNFPHDIRKLRASIRVD